MDMDIDFMAAESWDDRMDGRIGWLRENQPVHWSEKSGLWVVSTFEDVSGISKDQKTFTSGQGVRPGNPATLGLIDEEEPRHGKLRNLINRGFTPRMVKKLEDVFLGIATETIDAIADRGECDFVDDLAVPMPLLLIAEMLGIHRKDRERFHRWSDGMIAADGNMDNPQAVALAGQCLGGNAAVIRRGVVGPAWCLAGTDRPDCPHYGR